MLWPPAKNAFTVFAFLNTLLFPRLLLQSFYLQRQRYQLRNMSSCSSVLLSLRYKGTPFQFKSGLLQNCQIPGAQVDSSATKKGIPVPGVGNYFQRAQPQFSAGPNLMRVSKPELRTSSRASQAAQLHCSGIWKSGTLVWAMHCMYFSLKSGAGSTRGFVVWKLYLVHWPTLHLILKVNGLSFT